MGSDAGVEGRRGRRRTQQRRQRLNAAGSVVVGRVRSARGSRCRCAADGWERTADTQRGRTWVEQRGRAQGLSTVNAGCLDGAVGAVGAVGAASVSRAAAHSRKASEQHWVHYRSMQGGQRRGRRGPRRVFNVESGRRARCEVWVRLERTRTKAVWGSFPTQSSALATRDSTMEAE